MDSNKSDTRLFLKTVRQQPLFVALIVGLLASFALVVYVLLEGPGQTVIRWVALVPAIIGISRFYMISQARSFVQPTVNIAEELQQTNITLQQQVQDLTHLRDVMLVTSATFDRTTILDEIMHAITEQLHFDRCLVLRLEETVNAITFAAYSHTVPDSENQFLLEQLQLDLTESHADPLLGQWTQCQATLIDDQKQYSDSLLNWVLTTLDFHLFYAVPLQTANQFKGVLLVDNSLSNTLIMPEQQYLLDTLAVHVASTLENAWLYQLTDEQLNGKVQELEILSRIDRELNYTLSIERVLNLTVDWGLRFTGSNAAAVALVDPDAHVFRYVVGYGYDPAQWEALTQQDWSLKQGIVGRVARQGVAENISNVRQDPDYIEIVAETQSHLIVPVVRENRVIAVISLESQKLDAFTSANMEFTQRLAARAAAALDNANLFNDTLRERQKLELILRNIADAVIVVGHDNKLVLINQAAMAAFKLSPKETYTGRVFEDVFQTSALVAYYQRARDLEQGLIEELTLGNGHTLHVSIVPASQIGWSIVTHDITPFKQTEKLKNELLATTSHDLKNPLSTIKGYVDLLSLTNELNEQGEKYVLRVQDAVSHMRQLIDDLLDMARIESGITLRYQDIQLKSLVEKMLSGFGPQLEDKKLSVSVDIPANLPPIPADEGRLSQVLNNLISNAIKYTPPEGHIEVQASLHRQLVQVSVQDDGFGISPEDQAQVFARFFRIRTPETEAIEGTGLGLAIVKSLVEVHGGQIGLESHLGEGSTFHFTLPLTPAQTIDNGANSA